MAADVVINQIKQAVTVTRAEAQTEHACAEVLASTTGNPKEHIARRRARAAALTRALEKLQEALAELQ